MAIEAAGQSPPVQPTLRHGNPPADPVQPPIGSGGRVALDATVTEVLGAHGYR